MGVLMSNDAYILIVEDEPDTQALMSSLVESLGIPFRVAQDGLEALDHIREETPVFVILDLMMPRMDGFSVLGRLKLDRDKRDIPILVVTGAMITEEQERELRGLVLDVMRKGEVSMEEIGQLIKETLETE
jgi:CheY-like chemotaxis protein